MKNLIKSKYIVTILALNFFFVSCDEETLDRNLSNERYQLLVTSERPVTIPGDDDSGLAPVPAVVVGEKVTFSVTTPDELIESRDWEIDGQLLEDGTVGTKTFTDVQSLTVTFTTPNNEQNNLERGGFDARVREIFKNGDIVRRVVKVVVRSSIKASFLVGPSAISAGGEVSYSVNLDVVGIDESDSGTNQISVEWEFPGGVPEKIEKGNLRDVVKVQYPQAGKYGAKLKITRNWPAKSSDSIMVTDAVTVVDGPLIAVDASQSSVSPLGDKVEVSFTGLVQEVSPEIKDGFSGVYEATVNGNVVQTELDIKDVVRSENKNSYILELNNIVPLKASKVIMNFEGEILSEDLQIPVLNFTDAEITYNQQNFFQGTIYDFEAQQVNSNIDFNYDPGQPLLENSSIKISSDGNREGAIGDKYLKATLEANANTVFARNFTSQTPLAPGTYVIRYWTKSSIPKWHNPFIVTATLGWNKPPFEADQKNLATEWEMSMSPPIKIDADESNLIIHIQFAPNADAEYEVYMDDFELIKIE